MNAIQIKRRKDEWKNVWSAYKHANALSEREYANSCFNTLQCECAPYAMPQYEQDGVVVVFIYAKVVVWHDDAV